MLSSSEITSQIRTRIPYEAQITNTPSITDPHFTANLVDYNFEWSAFHIDFQLNIRSQEGQRPIILEVSMYCGMINHRSELSEITIAGKDANNLSKGTPGLE